jgi:hypothetical protein
MRGTVEPNERLKQVRAARVGADDTCVKIQYQTSMSSPGLTGRSSTPRPIGSSTAVSGILDRPGAQLRSRRAMTAENVFRSCLTCLRILAARFASELSEETCPSDIRGRRECRVLAATHGPRAVKKHGEGTTGSAETSGIPCATVLTLMARSPWEPGLFAPIAREPRKPSELDLSVGRPGPRAFASASVPLVRTKTVRVAEASIASRAQRS